MVEEKPKKKTSGAKKPAQDPANVIKFVCRHCKQRVPADVKFADRFITCPKCQKKVAVPKDQAEADFDAANYDLSKFLIEVPKNCVKCKAKIKKGSVICVSCGFDYREGRVLAIEDRTIKEDDQLRGKPAMQFMIGEVIFLVGALGTAIWRGTTSEILWWEQGIYLSIILICISMFPGHLQQFLAYRNTPRRPTATVLEEDRAERQEAANPLGYYTGAVVFLCILISFAIMFPLFGGEMFTEAKKHVFWFFGYLWEAVFGPSAPSTSE